MPQFWGDVVNFNEMSQGLRKMSQAYRSVDNPANLSCQNQLKIEKVYRALSAALKRVAYFCATLK